MSGTLWMRGSMVMNRSKDKYYYSDGSILEYNVSDKTLHREDGPAIEWANGSKAWYHQGKYHRDNGLPAVELADGSKFWYHQGELHRDNGLPAIEYANGSKFWYHQGELHRDNGLPAVERSDGSKEWYCQGEYLFSTYDILKGKLTKEDANLLCLAHFGCEVQWDE